MFSCRVPCFSVIFDSLLWTRTLAFSSLTVGDCLLEFRDADGSVSGGLESSFSFVYCSMQEPSNWLWSMFLLLCPYYYNYSICYCFRMGYVAYLMIVKPNCWMRSGFRYSLKAYPSTPNWPPFFQASRHQYRYCLEQAFALLRAHSKAIQGSATTHSTSFHER